MILTHLHPTNQVHISCLLPITDTRKTDDRRKYEQHVSVGLNTCQWVCETKLQNISTYSPIASELSSRRGCTFITASGHCRPPHIT